VSAACADEEQGYSEGEATGLAVRDQALSMGLDFAGGFISGGVMSGVEGGIHTVMGRRNAAQNQQNAAAEGPTDGATPSATAQSTITHPTAENTVQGPQSAAEGQAQQGQMQQGRGETPSPAPGNAAVQADPTVNTAQSQQGTQEGKQYRPESIRQTLDMLSESYRMGYASEEEFNEGLKAIQEQAGLAGREMLDGIDIAGPVRSAEERSADNGAAEFDRTTAGAEPAQGGQQLSDGDGGRLSGSGASGQDGGMAAGGSRGSADAARAAIERQNLGRTLGLQPVSGRELGVSGGTDAKTAIVLP